MDDTLPIVYCAYCGILVMAHLLLLDPQVMDSFLAGLLQRVA